MAGDRQTAVHLKDVVDRNNLAGGLQPGHKFSTRREPTEAPTGDSACPPHTTIAAQKTSRGIRAQPARNHRL